MRVVPPVENVPATVNRYLLPHERQIVSVKIHSARLIPPLVTVIGGLFLAIALSPVMRGNMRLGIWLIMLLLSLYLARAAFVWLFTYFVVTSIRIFMCDLSGITLQLNLTDVKGVRVTRTLGGRILGYGTLILGSARIAIDSLPYPEQLYLEILGMLYVEDSDYGL